MDLTIIFYLYMSGFSFSILIFALLVILQGDAFRWSKKFIWTFIGVTIFSWIGLVFLFFVLKSFFQSKQV